MYAIFPKYPDNRKLVLKDIAIPTGTTISFLSTKENLHWKQSGENVEISLPEYNPNKMSSPYAYAVKIENFGRFASKPVIEIKYDKAGPLQPFVHIYFEPGATVYFTTDGSEPGLSSTKYSTPFLINETSTIKAKAFMPGNLSSNLNSQKAIRYKWLTAAKLSEPQPGIAYKYYEPAGKIDMSSINNTPTTSGVTAIISHQNKKRPDKFAFEFTGYIKIDKDGIYTFFTDSDDGSLLYIDDEEVVNNDGDHGNVEKNGKAALKKGFHKIKVLYFDSGGGNSLKVSMQPEGGKKESIPAALLFH